MQASPLRLEHYNLLAIRLEPVPDSTPANPGDYVDFSQAALSSSIQAEPVQLATGEPKYAVELQLDCKPKDEMASHFPYTFHIKLVGFFDGHRLPEEARYKLVTVNGASMLFGVARDLLMGLSLRNVYGAIMLPSVSFADIAAMIDAKQATSPEAPSPEPGAPARTRKPRKRAA